MTSPVYDKERWAAYEAETERRMRQALGDTLYDELERITGPSEFCQDGEWVDCTAFEPIDRKEGRRDES